MIIFVFNYFLSFSHLPYLGTFVERNHNLSKLFQMSDRKLRNGITPGIKFQYKSHKFQLLQCHACISTNLSTPKTVFTARDYIFAIQKHIHSQIHTTHQNTHTYQILRNNFGSNSVVHGIFAYFFLQIYMFKS